MTRYVVPVNVSTLTQALVDMLAAADGVGLANVLVERSEELPASIPENGYVGIYRNRIRYQSRTVGVAAGQRMGNCDLIVSVSQFDGNSGASCEDRLESLIVSILTAVFTDPSIAGVAAMLGPDIDIRYERYEKTQTGFSQTAFIYLTALIPTEIRDIP